MDTVSNRPPPAFQWYASDLLADEAFLLANLNERGLYATLLSYCWVNRDISADHQKMARLLGLPNAEVKETATSRLISKNFASRTRDGEVRLFCPELERQRTVYDDRKRSLANGGRAGGTRTQQQRRQALSQASSFAKTPEKKGEEMNREEVLQEEEESEWLRGAGLM